MQQNFILASLLWKPVSFQVPLYKRHAHSTIPTSLIISVQNIFMTLYSRSVSCIFIPYSITKGGNIQVLYTLHFASDIRYIYDVVHHILFYFSGSPGQDIVIDSYTHNSTLTLGDSVPFGSQLILVCRVVGLPYGTPLSYTWTCPNGPCEVEGYYGRKIYNEHILTVNTTSTSDAGTYTCQVTATGELEINGLFTLRVTGMSCTTAVS